MLYPILYLEINLASVMLVLFIRFKTLGISRMISQRTFSSAIDAEAVFFLSDTASVLISCGLIPAGKVGLLAAKSIYFLSTALMCFFWFIYFERLQGSRFVASRRAVLLSSCLVWIMGVLLVINLFNGMLFYVDDQGIYRRGPLFVIQYLLSYTYVFAACGHALVGCFQKHRIAQRHLLISLALFPVAPGIAGMLQFIHPELPVACIALAGATLILYQNWLDELISVDPLTRLNNRKQLLYHFDQWQRREDSIPLYLLLIDANKFKQINDTYGHAEGDAALVKIADALRMACHGLPHRANIARYGGDEFVVLARVDGPEEISRLTNRIHECLEKMNQGSPYPLTVSIGITKAAKWLTLESLLKEADAKLYQEKRR